MYRTSAFAVLVAILISMPTFADECVKCHRKMSPGVVKDWEASKHATVKKDRATCATCHGKEHKDMEDAKLATMPTAATCGSCHAQQEGQFRDGKHALAWTVMKAMPTTHMLPMQLAAGMKGCGGCHKLGVKSEEEVKALRSQGIEHGNASCDACHTRHLFSKKEAQAPQACQTCHMGFDHPQWEMYSSSKHGVRALLKQTGILPETAAAPTCQTCHMQDGNHEVRTAWGFLAVRLPLPEDPTWKADQITILQALGVLDPQGNPTARLEAVKAADVARLDQASFDKERKKMIKTCSQCHSENFARGELDKGDQIIRQADHQLAEAIRIVAGLYADGVLSKPANYAYDFPDLLAFHDAPTPIEHKLFVMHLKHRMRAFQGAFHSNPDYALWYGWSAMLLDLAEIKRDAEDLREKHARKSSLARN
jgi:hydroxylamine dehydrogenase